MAAKRKLTKTGNKQLAVDIQIAAGMTTLAILSGGQQQGQQGASQAQQQPQQGGPPSPQAGPPQQAPQGAPQQPQGQQQGPSLPPGLQAIAQVLKGANDPAAALAHVIFMAISRVEQALEQKHIQIDDRVWVMGGGVLDRVLFEVMIAIATILKYQPAQDPKFTAQTKSDVLDLMEDDDQNTKAMTVLHQKGLPMPKAPLNQQQQQQTQGLAAPQQGAPQ